MAVEMPQTSITNACRFPFRLPRLLWVGLASIVLSALAARADAGTHRAGGNEPVSKAEREEAELTVYGWVFGPYVNAAGAHKSLDVLAQQKIVLIERIC